MGGFEKKSMVLGRLGLDPRGLISFAFGIAGIWVCKYSEVL